MNTSDYHKKMAIFAASEWKTKLGLDTEIDAMEFKVLLKKRHDGDYQIARNGWVADYNDATTFLQLVQCGSDQNDNGNCNPQGRRADARKPTQRTDQAKRTQLQTQAAKLVMDDYPMLPLLQYTHGPAGEELRGRLFAEEPDGPLSQQGHVHRESTRARRKRPQYLSSKQQEADAVTRSCRGAARRDVPCGLIR